MAPEAEDSFLAKIRYFVTVLRMTWPHLHSLPRSIQYEMEENQFGGSKVIRQATYLPIGHKKWVGPKSGPPWPIGSAANGTFSTSLLVLAPQAGCNVLQLTYLSSRIPEKSRPNFTKLPVRLTVAKARTSSDNNGTHYLLPVFWIRFRFRIIGTCGVRRGLWPRDVSQWQATPRQAERQRFSFIPLYLSAVSLAIHHGCGG